jgi:hypothetical protein
MQIQRKTTKTFGHLGPRMMIINRIVQHHTPSMNTNHSAAPLEIDSQCGTTIHTLHGADVTPTKSTQNTSDVAKHSHQDSAKKCMQNVSLHICSICLISEEEVEEKKVSHNRITGHKNIYFLHIII